MSFIFKFEEILASIILESIFGTHPFNTTSVL